MKLLKTILIAWGLLLFVIMMSGWQPQRFHEVAGLFAFGYVAATIGKTFTD